MPPQQIKRVPFKRCSPRRQTEPASRSFGRIRHRLIIGYKNCEKPQPRNVKPRQKEVKPKEREVIPHPVTPERVPNKQDTRPVQNGVWNAMFEKLIMYKTEKGDCLVPQNYGDDLKLARWVKNQRQAKKSGKLTIERERRLESIGFGFSLRQKRTTWGEMFELVKSKVGKPESVPSCLQSVSDDPKLAKWVRTQYKNTNSLSEAQVHQLNTIGFWNNVDHPC